MIGQEFAGRTSLTSSLSSALRDPDDERCWICEKPGTACSSADHEAMEQGPERVDVEALVSDRAKAQTRKPVGRPPKDPAARAAKEAAHAAATPDVSVEQVPDAPVVAPEASVTAPPQPAGVHTLSPVPADAARPAPAPIPAGDPTEVRDVVTVPDGCQHPDEDRHRPNPETTVLVTDAADLFATGAWMSLPGGSRALTMDVERVWWAMGSPQPNYSTVGRKGPIPPELLARVAR